MAIKRRTGTVTKIKQKKKIKKKPVKVRKKKKYSIEEYYEHPEFFGKIDNENNIRYLVPRIRSTKQKYTYKYVFHHVKYGKCVVYRKRPDPELVHRFMASTVGHYKYELKRIKPLKVNCAPDGKLLEKT